MDWNYISGFFDADGSITFVKHHKNSMKTPQLSFSNNEKSILIEIQEFIYNELKIKGFISTKKQHNYTNYELKYVYIPKVLAIVNNINSLHPKKSYRINLIKNKLINIVPKNGKYNEELINKYNEFEKQFFSTFQ